MATWIARARKAVVAGASAGLLALAQAASDGAVTRDELGLVIGALIVGLLTYLVPNRPAESAAGRQ
jgi:hypothetical protein